MINADLDIGFDGCIYGSYQVCKIRPNVLGTCDWVEQLPAIFESPATAWFQVLVSDSAS